MVAVLSRKNLQKNILPIKFHTITMGKNGKDRDKEGKFTQMNGKVKLLLAGQKIVGADEEAAQYFGLTKDELIGRSWSDIFPPELMGEKEIKHFEEKIKSASEGEVLRFLWTFRRKDGGVFDAEVILEPGNVPDGGFVKASIDRICLPKSSEELYEIFAHEAPLGIYILREGRFVFVTPKITECSGFRAEELIGRHALSLVHPEDREKTRLAAIEMLKGKRTAPYEFRIITKTGNLRWIMETVIPIYFNNRREVLGNFMDVTDHRWAEDTLKEREERYRSILEHIEDGYYELDIKGNFSFFNNACLRILGYPREELSSLHYLTLTHEDHREETARIVDRVIKTGKSDRLFNWLIKRKDGFLRHIDATLTPIRGKDGNISGIRGIMRDVTEQKKAEETITYMAYHDALTGLPNRLLFNDRLNVALERARRNKHKLAVMMLDLDNFKEINDTLGHEVGDQLLQGVGNRLRGRLRKGDTVARMGGDEFMLLLPEIKQQEDALIVARKIIDSFLRPFFIDSKELRVTASLGVAIYPDDGEDFDTLKRKADLSMYAAKETGKNNYCLTQLRQAN